MNLWRRRFRYGRISGSRRGQRGRLAAADRVKRLNDLRKLSDRNSGGGESPDRCL